MTARTAFRVDQQKSFSCGRQEGTPDAA